MSANMPHRQNIFESAQIKEALRDFAETEEAVKTGKIEDKLGVELMIIKYSQK